MDGRYLDFLPWREQMEVVRALYHHRIAQPLDLDDDDDR